MLETFARTLPWLGIVCGLLSFEVSPGTTKTYLERLASFESEFRYIGPSPQEFIEQSPPSGVGEVRYPSDNMLLRAWLALPTGGYVKKLPAVVYFHGGFAFAAEDFTDARRFSDAGFVLMAPMLRGENGNPGNFELFLGEVDDAVAAVNWLAERPYVDEKRIYAFGHSSGGAIAALLALRTGVQIVHSASSGGLYPDSVFFDWADFAPFDVSRDEERQIRVLLGNLRWMQRRHFAFLGASDLPILQSKSLAEVEMSRFNSKLDVKIVPGDHFSSLPLAVEAYIQLINAQGSER